MKRYFPPLAVAPQVHSRLPFAWIALALGGLNSPKQEYRTMPESGTFDASICNGVVTGSCVMLIDDRIVYAGPIKGAPSSEGKTILMNACDFERLKNHVDRKRH
jgi:hypothetical protein